MSVNQIRRFPNRSLVVSVEQLVIGTWAITLEKTPGIPFQVYGTINLDRHAINRARGTWKHTCGEETGWYLVDPHGHSLDLSAAISTSLLPIYVWLIPIYTVVAILAARCYVCMDTYIYTVHRYHSRMKTKWLAVEFVSSAASIYCWPVDALRRRARARTQHNNNHQLKYLIMAEQYCTRPNTV